MTTAGDAPKSPRLGRHSLPAAPSAGGGGLRATLPPAMVALGYAALVVLGALTATVVLVLALLVVQAGIAVGWPRAVGSTAPGMVTATGLVAAAVADVWLALRDSPDSTLAPVAVAIGVSVVVAIALQLARRDGRPQAAASLAGSLVLATFTALGAVWIAVLGLGDGRELVVLGAVIATLPAVAVALLAATPWLGGMVGVLAATLLGAIAGSARGEVGLAYGLTVGFATGLTTMLALAPSGWGDPQARSQWASLAALPLLLVAPVVYLVGRLLLG